MMGEISAYEDRKKKPKLKLNNTYSSAIIEIPDRS